jgi:Hemerythrin HHE cation binding domain
MAAVYADDSRQLAAAWAVLEAELESHMEAEEEVILPGFGAHAPDDAAQIRLDHARIRALLSPLGVEVELHMIRAHRLALLVEALAAHALFEDTTMYPWAEAHLPAVEQRLMLTRLSRWLGTP